MQSWDGPRRLVYVAPPKTADTLYLEVFRHIHLYAGIPYAWGGRHAGWLQDAMRRGLECAAGVDPAADPANGDMINCRCFLEYLVTYNMTADGLWICHDTMGLEFNEMLAQAMPDAALITTIRDPFDHAMDMFNTFQAPMLNETGRNLMEPGQCEYDGPGYRDRFTASCFANLFIDPQLKHCHYGDTTMFYSQLCALGVGVDPTPTGAQVNSRFIVLPAEDPITSLLAALVYDLLLNPSVVRRIHESLALECTFGSQTSIPAPPNWRNATDELFPNMINGSQLADLLELEGNFTQYTAEAGLLHRQAARRAGRERRRYIRDFNYSSSLCWDVHFAPIPDRDYNHTLVPHAPAERWTEFDNANFRFSQIRMDMCMDGLLDAVNATSYMDPNPVAGTDAIANPMLSSWVTETRQRHTTFQGGVCYNSTGYSQDVSQGEHRGDALVSHRYKIAFETSAKSASMTATKYMQCRFDAQANWSSYPDYTRLMIMRDPTSRAVSAFLEVAMHYIAILRMPPAALRECAEAWPDDEPDLASSTTIWQPNSSWPDICQDALTRNPYTKRSNDGPGRERKMIGIDKPTMRATADSALLNALWELPPGCRQLGRTLNWFVPIAGQENLTSVTWWCDEPQCREECHVPEETMKMLIAHSLSDAAQQNVYGCDDQMFGGEHMWPQFLHIARAGRADAVMRLEHIEEDSHRFEHFIEQRLGRPLPPAPTNCSMTGMHENNGTVLEPSLSNQTMVTGIIERSPDLQRRICALYYHDFVCGGYELLPACVGPTSEWLNSTITDLLENRPVAQLLPESEATPIGPDRWFRDSRFAV